MACSNTPPPFFPLYSFLCTLMYKIAWIHKQHYYVRCLPVWLRLFLSFFFFPPSPHPLSHTQTPQTIHFLRSHTLRHISPGALFSWKWLIREAVENCGSSAPSMHTVRSYCLKNYVWLTVTRRGFFFFYTCSILSAYLCCSVILPKLSHLGRKQ